MTDFQGAVRAARDVAEQLERDDTAAAGSTRTPLYSTTVLAVAWIDQTRAHWREVYATCDGAARHEIDVAIGLCNREHIIDTDAAWRIVLQARHPYYNTVHRGMPGEWYAVDIPMLLGCAVPLWFHYLDRARQVIVEREQAVIAAQLAKPGTFIVEPVVDLRADPRAETLARALRVT